MLYSNLYPDSKLKITQLQEQFHNANEITNVVGWKRQFLQKMRQFYDGNSSKPL